MRFESLLLAARIQKIVALTAYLQRLGTDINKAPAPDTKGRPSASLSNSALHKGDALRD